MADFEQGDVVRVPFPYTDRSTRQHRPALVVSKRSVGKNQALIWVAMITSAENQHWDGDVDFGDQYEACGLPAPSKVRPCKLATIDSASAALLGKASQTIMSNVLALLLAYLGENSLH